MNHNIRQRALELAIDLSKPDEDHATILARAVDFASYIWFGLQPATLPPLPLRDGLVTDDMDRRVSGDEGWRLR